LANYAVDPKCRWFKTYSKEKNNYQKEEQTELFGYGTKFQVAQAVSTNWKDNPEELQAICDALESDDNWDEQKPVERGFKLAKLKRYCLAGLSEFGKKTEGQETKEGEYVNSSTLAGKAPALETDPKQETVNLEVVNPDFVKWQQKVVVCKSGQAAMEKLLPISDAPGPAVLRVQQGLWQLEDSVLGV
jgi:hypothetical protein